MGFIGVWKVTEGETLEPNRRWVFNPEGEEDQKINEWQDAECKVLNTGLQDIDTLHTHRAIRGSSCHKGSCCVTCTHEWAQARNTRSPMIKSFKLPPQVHVGLHPKGFIGIASKSLSNKRRWGQRRRDPNLHLWMLPVMDKTTPCTV